MSTAERGHRAWERVLDEMETFLLAAPAPVDAVAPEPWFPPELGPIPADLADRARDLLGRQQHLLEELRLARDAVRHQQAVTDRFIAAARRSDGPVYVDHSA